MKVALVTGSAGGLGKRIALDLAGLGYTLIMNYRNKKPDLKKIQQLSPDSIEVRADVSKKSDVKKLFRKIEQQFKHLDVVINAVGDFHFKEMHKTTSDDWKKMMESNFFSMLNCTEAAIPLMKREHFGRIINFGSAGCDRIILRELTTPYYAAKTSIFMATKAYAFTAPKGVTINMVSPGILETSIVKMQGVPIVHLNEIVNAIIYLLSPAADSINGANIEVTKGWNPGWK